MSEFGEGSPLAVLTASPQGLVTRWSGAARRLFDLPASAAIGRSLTTLVRERDGVERALVQLHRNQSVHSVCLTAHAAGSDDGRRALFACLDALRDRTGLVSEFIMTVRDLRSLVFQSGSGRDPGRLAVPNPGAVNGLTPRQRLVLELIAQGYSTQEIARQLSRSVKTVETHRAQLMKRLNISHVPGLVAFAIRAGLVTIA